MNNKMISNYHTHTKRCGHAAGEDKEYVEAAIRGNIKVLGFSDHCPWIFPDDFHSTIRMSLSEVDGYFHSLEELKREYKAEIKKINKNYNALKKEDNSDLTKIQKVNRVIPTKITTSGGKLTGGESVKD